MLLQHLGNSQGMLRVLSSNHSQIADFVSHVGREVLKSEAIILGHFGRFRCHDCYGLAKQDGVDLSKRQKLPRRMQRFGRLFRPAFCSKKGMQQCATARDTRSCCFFVLSQRGRIREVHQELENTFFKGAKFIPKTVPQVPRRFLPNGIAFPPSAQSPRPRRSQMASSSNNSCGGLSQ